MISFSEMAMCTIWLLDHCLDGLNAPVMVGRTKYANFVSFLAAEACNFH